MLEDFRMHQFLLELVNAHWNMTKGCNTTTYASVLFTLKI